MSHNKYADMTMSMEMFAAKALADIKLNTAAMDSATGMLKFRRPVNITGPIPVYALVEIVKTAEIRALREVMEAINAQPYEGDEARIAAFAKLREDYTESGKARYIIEHGVPEDTSDRNVGPGSAAAAVAMGAGARKTIEKITYDVLRGYAEKLKP